MQRNIMPWPSRLYVLYEKVLHTSKSCYVLYKVSRLGKKITNITLIQCMQENYMRKANILVDKALQQSREKATLQSHIRTYPEKLSKDIFSDKK